MNVERMKRYRKRTMTAPPRSFTVTPADLEAEREWINSWERGNDDTPAPPLNEWHGDVMRYAAAKGIRITRTVEEHPDGSKTIRWEESA